VIDKTIGVCFIGLFFEMMAFRRCRLVDVIFSLFGAGA
jgi:hypothetical protein